LSAAPSSLIYDKRYRADCQQNRYFDSICLSTPSHFRLHWNSTFLRLSAAGLITYGQSLSHGQEFKIQVHWGTVTAAQITGISLCKLTLW